MEKCIGRLLHQWDALTSYFESHDDRDKQNSRVQRVADWLTDPEMKMYYLFLQFILTPLNEFNRTFQVYPIFILLYQYFQNVKPVGKNGCTCRIIQDH